MIPIDGKLPIHIVMIKHKIFRTVKVGAIYINPSLAQEEVDRLNKANSWNEAYYTTRFLNGHIT